MNTRVIVPQSAVTTHASRLRRLAFEIPLIETTFARRGFYAGDAAKRDHLEQVGQVFVYGYHCALDTSAPPALGARLNLVDPAWRGFAFEGAALALALLDQLTPWDRHRWANFLAHDGAAHCYMVHVGAGWACARLFWWTERALARLDPLLRWLVVDGYGFHEGYFHARRSVERQVRPAKLSGYALRAFDQGLGRSLWFMHGADAARVAAATAAFAPARQADLWSGIGLACAYAGGGDRATLAELWSLAAAHRAQVAQGAAFAAQARQRAGNPAPHTEVACELFWGSSVAVTAAITDQALAGLPGDGAVPAYETWRQRIRAQFAAVRGAL